MGKMVKALAIFLRSANSTFAPSGWFTHAWSHICRHTNVVNVKRPGKMQVHGLHTCTSKQSMVAGLLTCSVLHFRLNMTIVI